MVVFDYIESNMKDYVHWLINIAFIRKSLIPFPLVYLEFPVSNKTEILKSPTSWAEYTLIKDLEILKKHERDLE